MKRGFVVKNLLFVYHFLCTFTIGKNNTLRKCNYTVKTSKKNGTPTKVDVPYKIFILQKTRLFYYHFS